MTDFTAKMLQVYTIRIASDASFSCGIMVSLITSFVGNRTSGFLGGSGGRVNLVGFKMHPCQAALRFAFLYTAGGRAPALSFVVSLDIAVRRTGR